jgi:hypothetical protein
MQQILILFGTPMFGVLGTIHLTYTFVGNKLNPRDPEVTSAMKQTSPVISNQTTI